MWGRREPSECNANILQVQAKAKMVEQFHYEPLFNGGQIVSTNFASGPVISLACSAEIKAVLVPDMNHDLRIWPIEKNVFFGQLNYFPVCGGNDCFNELVVADRCHSL